jgi:hypothetical protein
MPAGKKAGEICANLDTADYSCRIWETADYPELCRNFKPTPDFCGSCREEAVKLIAAIELITSS